MGSHDEYGKQLLQEAAGEAYASYGPDVEVDYGAGQPARIDGAVAGKIAIEIESRASKQVRGAVLDLICHRFTKKLLLLLPVHMSNPQIAAAQCRDALGRFVEPENFRVLVLKGHGGHPLAAADVPAIKGALAELGFSDVD